MKGIIFMKLKKILKPLEFLGKIISSMVNFILLSIVYFLGIGLTSIIAKIFNKKFLDLKKENKKTYWEEKEMSDKEFQDCFRQF